jgi:DNA-binding CsgD family transcriptional regulator
VTADDGLPEDVLASVSSFARALTHRPDPDRLMHALVLAVPARLAADCAILARVEVDGRLTIRASYGHGDALADYRPTLTTADLPLAQALRLTEPLVVATHEDAARAPQLSSLPMGPHPVVAPRVEWADSVVGLLMVGFDRDIADVRSTAAMARGMAAVLSLHLGPHWESLPVPAGQIGAEALSERQHTVLALMAEGLSNPRIAARIGFSESTVRHETMAIYRVLGVSGRRAAVQAATRLGLLDRP